jgi:hypothetical protein
MQCHQCGKKIRFVRALLNHKYCCKEHQWSHLEEMNRMGLQLLMERTPKAASGEPLADRGISHMQFSAGQGT